MFQVGGISTLFCSTARMPLSVHTICPTGSLSSMQSESKHYNRGRENELHYFIGDDKVIPNIHTSILTTGPERRSVVCQSPKLSWMMLALTSALQASPPALLSVLPAARPAFLISRAVQGDLGCSQHATHRLNQSRSLAPLTS